jgi:hypothetical protein
VNAFVRRLSGCVMAVLMLFNTACYSFVPVAAGAVPKNADYVRVRLSASGTSELSSQLGPGVQWAEGTLSERRSDGTLVVGVVQVRMGDGLDRFWSGANSVAFAPAQLAEVHVKTLDRGRSRTAAVAFGAALVALALVAIGGGGAQGSDGGVIQPPP